MALPGGALRASDSSVETPTSGIPRAPASARAVAIPIRSPVNVPGPTPTAIRSTSSQPAPARSSTSAISGSSRGACAAAVPRRRVVAALDRCRLARSPSATVVALVAVSNAEDPHSISTSGGRRPRAASRTRAAMRPKRGDRLLLAAGHSTNAIVSGPR